MSYTLMHLARMLRDSGGYPAFGNVPGRWKDGEHLGLHNPHGQPGAPLIRGDKAVPTT